MRRLWFHLSAVRAYIGAGIVAGLIMIGVQIGWPAVVNLFSPTVKPVWLPTQPPKSLHYLPHDEQGPRISASSAILIEASTGTVLFAKEEHKSRPIASTTKILTALLALEQGNLNDVVSISAKAASTRGSSIHVRTGQEMKLRDLLYGLLLQSGNDAAVAIAEHLGGSVDAFADMMTLRAQELGAHNSRFRNPHGLDSPGHYSSAYDLALMARVALLSPAFRNVISHKEYSVPWAGGNRTWYNTNRLLWSFDGMLGGKTGTTGGAGECLVSAASRSDTILIAIVLNSRDRWADSRALLEYGFDRFHLVEPAPLQRVVVEVPVANGMQATVPAIPEERLAIVVPDSMIRRLFTKVEVKPVKAPVRAMQPVGELVLLSDEEELGRVRLMAARSVRRWTPIGELGRRFFQR